MGIMLMMVLIKYLMNVVYVEVMIPHVQIVRVSQMELVGKVTAAVLQQIIMVMIVMIVSEYLMEVQALMNVASVVVIIQHVQIVIVR